MELSRRAERQDQMSFRRMLASNQEKPRGKRKDGGGSSRSSRRPRKADPVEDAISDGGASDGDDEAADYDSMPAEGVVRPISVCCVKLSSTLGASWRSLCHKVGVGCCVAHCGCGAVRHAYTEKLHCDIFSL
jgi:hypothetical protein